MEESEKLVYLNDVEYFSAKLEAEPSSVLFIPLAKAYIKLERYDEAVDILTDGIDEHPDVFSAKALLAQAYLGQGELGDAQAILTELLVTDRNNYLAHKLMGDIHRNGEEIKKALVSYRTALNIAPEDKDLHQLMEELMHEHGIVAHEIQAEPSLMDADDEMLDQLSSELADQVRSDVGESDLGSREASDDEVSSTVDSIVGVDSSSASEDMSVDNYQGDSSADYGDELEEELVASFDDEIIETPMSNENGEPVTLDDEIMQSDGDEPSEDDVAALAAELGADLGLDVGEAPADDVDAALNEVFEEKTEDTAEEPEGIDTGLSFFDSVESSAEDDIDDDLKAMLGTDDADEQETEPELDDDLKAMLGEETSTEADADSDAEAEAEIDAELKAMLGEEPSADEAVTEAPADDFDFGDIAAVDEETGEVVAPVESEPELDDDLKALLGEEPAEKTEAEADAEAEIDAELKALLAEETSVEADVEEEASVDEFDFDDITAVDEESGEVVAPVDTVAETDEVYEASMDELLESAPEEAEDEYDNLSSETREQVNRLENLLETIKNNASK